jgi:hypothetical protein
VTPESVEFIKVINDILCQAKIVTAMGESHMKNRLASKKWSSFIFISDDVACFSH